MTTILRQVLPEFHRTVRMERMTGRGLQDGAWHREIRKLSVLILLEDGVHKTFPPHQIDPTWTPAQLETVLRIYKLEYDRLMSPEAKHDIARKFADATGTTVNSFEHHAQVRGADLKVRLAALCDVTKQRREDLVSEADALLTTVSAARLPEITCADQHPEDRPTPAILPKPDKVVSPCASGSDLIQGELTIGALMEQFAVARTTITDHDAAYTRDIAGIFWRLAKQDALSDAVARQRAADLRLFCFVTGVQTIDEVEQWHLRRYTDALKEIPKNFLRSEYDQRRSYGQVKAMAANMPRDQVGLADGTTKRHLKSRELLLARAISEGQTIRFTSDVKGLRPKTKGRVLNHKKRAVFRLSEARTVFSHTLSQGHKSPGRRHDPGDVVIKDSRYWVPLILAYTGARRAEIAGLLPSDITVIDGIPIIIIQSNQWRGLKNEESGTTDPLKKLTRYVPVHSHLRELGLMEHAEKMRTKGETFLFPDVIPTPRKGSSRSLSPDPAAGVEKFGETIDDTWRKSLRVALKGNPRELCMHSLRHFVNDTLLHNRDVLDVTRFDITGHTYRREDQGSQKGAYNEINEQTYRDDVPIHIKAAAIEQLPRLF